MIKSFSCKEHKDKAITICASPTCTNRIICERSDCQKLHKHNSYKMSHIYIEDIEKKRQQVFNYKLDISRTVNALLTSISKRFEIIQNQYLNFDSKIRDLELEDIPVEDLINFMDINLANVNLKNIIMDLARKLDEEFKKVMLIEQKKIGAENAALSKNLKKLQSKIESTKMEIPTKYQCQNKKNTPLGQQENSISELIQSKNYVSTINFFYQVDFESLQKQSKIFELIERNQTVEVASQIKMNFNNMMFTKKLNINNKKCIYRASEFNFKSEEYKRKLLDKPKTLILFLAKNSKTGNTFIIGAYLSKPWQNTFVYQKQIQSFMFQLVNGDIWNLKSNTYPILYSPPKDSKQLYGPVIGRFDLCVSDRCDKYESFTSKNMSYNIKEYGPFLIQEYEVFYLKD